MEGGWRAGHGSGPRPTDPKHGIAATWIQDADYRSLPSPEPARHHGALRRWSEQRPTRQPGSNGEPRMHRATTQEPGEGAVKVRLIEQERVMAFVGRELHKRHVGSGAIEGTGNRPAFGGRIQP